MFSGYSTLTLDGYLEVSVDDVDIVELLDALADLHESVSSEEVIEEAKCPTRLPNFFLQDLS